MWLCKTIRSLPRSVRQFSVKNVNIEEIRIPVPWGHIAGKWWGPQDKRPILCTHGWEDNCGTYDTLIPLLPGHVGYLAIDYPGHGLSSQLPPGTFYHRIDNAILLRRIAEHFNWPKLSLMGHSMGAILNFQYTVLYPDKVDFLICLDGMKPLVPDGNKIDIYVKIIQDFIKYDCYNNLNKEPPSYNFEEMEKMLHEANGKSIALDACKHILKRNIAESLKEPGKYYFVRDPRLKAVYANDLLGWSQNDSMEFAHRITCPTFLSKATRSPYYENKQNALEVIEILKKNKDFEMHAVEGTHHVHLNNPERLCKLISDFIKNYDVENRKQGAIMPEVRI